MIYIGIDPGTHTGMAVWDSGEGRFLTLETLPIHRALDRVLRISTARDNAIRVVFEDARQRKWYGRTESEVRRKIQGAGSVKRDCAIWEDFLKDYGIPFLTVKPGRVATKVTPSWFKTLTGWEGRTSEHSRDAAMLVFGR